MAKFTVEMGLPEMDRLWNDLLSKVENGTLAGDERLLLKNFAKRFSFSPKLAIATGEKRARPNLKIPR
jgi:hypothetical protein